jgi:hypothetical protein
VAITTGLAPALPWARFCWSGLEFGYHRLPSLALVSQPCPAFPSQSGIACFLEQLSEAMCTWAASGNPGNRTAMKSHLAHERQWNSKGMSWDSVAGKVLPEIVSLSQTTGQIFQAWTANTRLCVGLNNYCRLISDLTIYFDFKLTYCFHLAFRGPSLFLDGLRRIRFSLFDPTSKLSMRGFSVQHVLHNFILSLWSLAQKNRGLGCFRRDWRCIHWNRVLGVTIGNRWFGIPTSWPISSIIGVAIDITVHYCRMMCLLLINNADLSAIRSGSRPFIA